LPREPRSRTEERDKKTPTTLKALLHFVQTLDGKGKIEETERARDSGKRKRARGVLEGGSTQPPARYLESLPRPGESAAHRKKEKELKKEGERMSSTGESNRAKNVRKTNPMAEKT